MLPALTIAYPIMRRFPCSDTYYILYLQSFLVFAFRFFHLKVFIFYSHPQNEKTSRLFRPISLTSCLSKLFACIILSRLLFLESYSHSARPTNFRRGRSIIDQILYLSQSFSDMFNEPKPSSRTILATIDISKKLCVSGNPLLPSCLLFFHGKKRLLDFLELGK